MLFGEVGLATLQVCPGHAGLFQMRQLWYHVRLFGVSVKIFLKFSVSYRTTSLRVLDGPLLVYNSAKLGDFKYAARLCQQTRRFTNKQKSIQTQ